MLISFEDPLTPTLSLGGEREVCGRPRRVAPTTETDSIKGGLLRYARNDGATRYIWSNLKNWEGEDFISACLVGSVPLRYTSTMA